MVVDAALTSTCICQTVFITESVNMSFTPFIYRFDPSAQYLLDGQTVPLAMPLSEQPSEMLNNDDDIPEKKTAICAVCKEVTTNQHLHYGALCCLSCRAFFRRANQSARQGYKCKSEGGEGCDTSFKNRKKCRKCRYEKCLSIGMKPTMVLSDNQKKIRFRKKDWKSIQRESIDAFDDNTVSEPLPNQDFLPGCVRKSRTIDGRCPPQPPKMHPTRCLSMFELYPNSQIVENQSQSECVEDNQLDSLITPNVRKELKMEQTSDELRKIFETAPQLPIQSDTLAELESTLRLASERNMNADCVNMDLISNEIDGASSSLNDYLMAPVFSATKPPENLSLCESWNRSTQDCREELSELYLHAFMLEYQDATHAITAESTLVQTIAALQIDMDTKHVVLQKEDMDGIIRLISNQYNYFAEKQNAIQVRYLLPTY